MSLRAALAVVVLAASTAGRAGIAPDAAREQRWAEQVVPQVVVGDAIWLATPHAAKVLALYAEPSRATRNAIVVVHGLGVHPDWEVIGVLRSALADAGFATLSVQMPVLAADAPRDGYAALFPDAGERLDAATAWLRAKGYARIAVVSHSLGAAMVNAWVARTDTPAVDAWVPIGLQVAFAAAPRLPVLDVVAEHDFEQALELAHARARALPADGCSSSLVVSDADHYFAKAAARLATAITPFLQRAFDGLCTNRDRRPRPPSRA